jgi:hypothetical protein
MPKHPSIKVAIFTCTRYSSPVLLYPEDARGEPFLRSAHDPFSQIACVSLETAVPLGFCCCGFSSTAGYVPGNEAQKARKPLSDFCSFPVVPCRKASLVFIRATRKDFSTFSRAKPFGFDSGRK